MSRVATQRILRYRLLVKVRREWDESQLRIPFFCEPDAPFAFEEHDRPLVPILYELGV